jgi:gliding motility-associated-like protein
MDAYDTKAPRPVHLITASVSNPNYEVTIDWTKTTNFDAKGYRLYRRETSGGERKIVYSSNDINITSIKDSITLSKYPYCYEVEVVDYCDNVSIASSLGCIMLLNGKAEKLSHHLKWNEYEKWNENVDYYNIYKKEDSSSWKFIASVNGNQNSFTDNENNITNFVKDHCYQVEAIEKNGYNAKSRSTVICLEQQPIVWMPNSFTPAFSYTLNDYFGPKGTYINRYEMRIINRWGQVVYQTENSAPWDGKINGGFVPEGIYMYQLTVYSYDNKTYYYNGTVTILK